MMTHANNESRSQSSRSDSDDQFAMRKPVFHFWRCFWLSFLAISLAYAGYCFYVPANQIAWANDFAVAQKQSMENGKPIILYFTGEWCVPCRIMKRQVWADPEVMARVNSQFIPVAIDVDDPKNTALLERYNVKGSPITIITDAYGNARAWRTGGTGRIEFLKFLSEVDPPNLVVFSHRT